jgi:gamma-glutamylcysteine synthetase
LEYCDRFRSLLKERVEGRSERTFGFEYEFISQRALDHETFRLVRGLLPVLGFPERNGLWINEQEMYITFEPGGQIEFSSPPLSRNDGVLFSDLMQTIETTIQRIGELAGVDYITVPYIQGRDQAPMLLEAARYRNLHGLLKNTGERGHDMMKGTAAIHLHASLCSLDELLPMWELMCAMSKEDGYAMGPDRRDIWNRTDPTRCGLTCAGAQNIDSSDTLLEKLVEFAMKALDLDTSLPFERIRPRPDFSAFLYHFTTIFTDVRLNTKGMTLELRTPDTRPIHLFKGAWIDFLDTLQRCM